MTHEGAIGPPVDPRPATRPERTTLEGRDVQLVPLDPAAHGDALFEATCGAGTEHLWRYLPEAPSPDRASFAARLERKARSDDPLLFAIVERTRGGPPGTRRTCASSPRTA